MMESRGLQESWRIVSFMAIARILNSLVCLMYSQKAHCGARVKQWIVLF